MKAGSSSTQSTRNTEHRDADRYLHLYCDGTRCSPTMACAQEELESRDHQVGVTWHCGTETKPIPTALQSNRTHATQRTIKFINGDAASIHGSLKVGSIYTSESGEWKLGGLEVLSSVKDDESVIYVSRH
jgi:hypothetical protein